MADLAQNTLYLTTPGSYIARDHLTLQVEVPIYPEGLAPEERGRDKATDWRKVSIPIHHLESVCVFGPSTISPPGLDLCWEHGVAVNFLSENGYLQARLTGVADTSVTLRRAQFRAADDPSRCAAIARQIIAGKLQNSRNSLLRAARESEISNLRLRRPPTPWPGRLKGWAAGRRNKSAHRALWMRCEGRKAWAAPPTSPSSASCSNSSAASSPSPRAPAVRPATASIAC